MKAPELSVILPAFNEAKNIPLIVDKIAARTAKKLKMRAPAIRTGSAREPLVIEGTLTKNTLVPASVVRMPFSPK